MIRVKNISDRFNFLTVDFHFKIKENSKSDVLLKAEVRTVPRLECNEQYMRYNEQAKHVIYQSGISESQYCAHDPLRRRAICNGDSGMHNFFFE